VRLGIQQTASSGHPRCRESATYVHDPGHCEPPDDRRCNSSVPGCGEKSQAVRSSLADRIRERKKKFCRVTTRRRNFWCWNGLGRGLGPLAARSFRLGMLGFDLGGLATFGLPLRRQPAENLPLAFGLLAVALVPAPWLVLASAPFTQAAPQARVAPSGLGTVLSFNVVVAHGRLDLPREKLEEDVSPFSSGAIKTRTRRFARQSKVFPGNKTKKKTALEVRLRRRHENQRLVSWRSAYAHNWR